MLELFFAAALLSDVVLKSASVDETRSTAVATKDEDGLLAGVAVTVECTARVNGRVDGCHVLGETHPGLGFGEAAIALMRDAVIEPPTRDIQFAHTIQFTPNPKR